MTTADLVRNLKNVEDNFIERKAERAANSKELRKTLVALRTLSQRIAKQFFILELPMMEDPRCGTIGFSAENDTSGCD